MYLTARSSERGMAAVAELMEEGRTVHFHQLDIDDSTSIERIRDFMKGPFIYDVCTKMTGTIP